MSRPPVDEASAYLMMLLAVVVRHFFSLGPQMSLHGWVEDELLPNRMAGQFPHKLVTVALLMIGVTSIGDYLIVELLQFPVVLDNSTRDSTHSGDGV